MKEGKEAVSVDCSLSLHVLFFKVLSASALLNASLCPPRCWSPAVSALTKFLPYPREFMVL